MTSKNACHRLTPKLIESLRSYRREDFFFDLIAGVTVGLVALPLAMAFAISSGVPPQAGIYTAIVAGLVVSALGGSRCQIAGPTGAFVVIVAGIATNFGMAGLLTCTLMAGAMLLVMGWTGLGAAVRFIPRPVTIGFTNGIAILIASTQVKDFFGLSAEHVPSEFVDRVRVLLQHFDSIHPLSLAIAGVSLLIVVLWPRIMKTPAGVHRRLAGRYRRVCRSWPKRRNGRQPVRRDSDRTAAVRRSRVAAGPCPSTSAVGTDRRPVGGD